MRLARALAVGEQARQLRHGGVVADDEHGRGVTGVLADRLERLLGAAEVDAAPELDELRVRATAARLLPRLPRALRGRADDEVGHEPFGMQPPPGSLGVPASSGRQLAVVVGLAEPLLGLGVPHEDQGLLFAARLILRACSGTGRLVSPDRSRGSARA